MPHTNNDRILIIEDESSIADTIMFALQQEGFSCETTIFGHIGIELIQQNTFDFVVLDVGLPDMSGFEVCKKIRNYSQVPILFLTARSDEIDRVVGFEIGADDYVTKPFSARELVSRVKAILKRSRQHDQRANVAKNDFSIDELTKRICFQNQALSLTAYEYGVLSLLINNPTRVYSREEIMQAVWSEPEMSFDRAVDTLIKGLRAKLKAINPNENSIVTHRSMGYSFSPTKLI